MSSPEIAASLDDWKQNFDKLLEHRLEILDNPSLRWVQTTTAFYVQKHKYGCGYGLYYIGALLSSWDQGLRKHPCPVCSHSAFVLNSRTDLMVPKGEWNGYCPTCADLVHGNDIISHKAEWDGRPPFAPGFLERYLYVAPPHRFDFKEGVIAPPRPTARLYIASWQDLLAWL